jgi:pheromone shutdown-related protein TraB
MIPAPEVDKISNGAFPAHCYGSDVHVIRQYDRMIILVGTAHVSQESVDLVNMVIEQEQPDSICLELDERRYQALTQQRQWQSPDLKTIIRNKQLPSLMFNLLISAYQKKLGNKLGITPGAELQMAAKMAKKLHIPISLCDRDVRITLKRAWQATPFLQKGYLLVSLMYCLLLGNSEISEEKLKDLKQQDVLSRLMDEIGQSLPDLKRVLIDERDSYLAEKIKSSPGKRIVAVVGAGHISGIMKRLVTDHTPESSPPVSRPVLAPRPVH